MSMISLFNSTVSPAINKGDAVYKALIGDEEFVPETVIVDSADYNCGALCNELELAREVCTVEAKSLNIDIASGEELDEVVTAFLDLPRRGNVESDTTYRNRFKFLVTQNTNPSRCTRWAIIDAIRHFISDARSIQIVERFDSSNLYFQVRIEGTDNTEGLLFIDSTVQGYLDNNFIGGVGVGAVITYLGFMLNRIKAAGVDFDILFISQTGIEKTGYAVIGTVQVYKTADARVKVHMQALKTADAVIV
jgi:hypothetical protein